MFIKSCVIFILSLLIMSFHLYGDDETKEKDEKEEKIEEGPPKIGNFALPPSQQPSGLFAFGGNIVDKGEVQLYFFADKFVGRDRLITDFIPSVLYGIS